MTKNEVKRLALRGTSKSMMLAAEPPADSH